MLKYPINYCFYLGNDFAKMSTQCARNHSTPTTTTSSSVAIISTDNLPTNTTPISQNKNNSNNNKNGPNMPQSIPENDLDHPLAVLLEADR